jgi:hypothetical protein
MRKITPELLLTWDLRIREVETNGYSVREYCLKNGLTERQYYYWYSKVKGNGNLPERQEAVPEDFSEIAFSPEGADSVGLSICFGNGIKIVPEKDFNESEFIRVAKILRGLCKC